MALCPKCESELEAGAKKCAACGYILPVSGTLDPTQFKEAKDALAKESDSEQAQDKPGGTIKIPQDGLVPSPENGGEVDDKRGDTVPIPAGDDAAQPAKRRSTQVYSEEQRRGVEGKGDSGTPGRLKKIWGVSADDSTASPNRTIKIGDAQASDSVFDRISPRLLVAGTINAISEKAERKSQPENRQKIHETIANACSDVPAEKADYELQGFLGQGGMGVVIEARQRTIERSVAIKMVQPGSGDGSEETTMSQMKRFFYEAQITGMLDHPNIVPVYELGVSNQILFYSMKKIVGKEWEETILLKEENSKEENLGILMKVCDAMAFAHKKNVIHRDLKPENIMIGEFGEVLVTDWGCAVDLSRGERFMGAGSPPWMAPEMANHNVHQIGPRSDIYLLGALLYQIIAGYPPHPGKDKWECLEFAARNEILPVNQQDSLLEIAYKAMETDPDNRYQTVTEFQEAIELYQTHAESTLLSDRSLETFDKAKEQSDYALFSRSQFGFEEAIELWPANRAAQKGLSAVRLAYGECAFEQGDYELCTNVLDQNDEAEAELYKQALKEKDAIEGRARRNRQLSYAFVGSLALLLVASGVFAYIQRETQLELKLTNGNLTAAKGDLEEANVKLDEEKADLEKTNKELIATQGTLEKTNSALELNVSLLDTKNWLTELSQFNLIEKNKELDNAITQLDASLIAERAAKQEADENARKESVQRSRAEIARTGLSLGAYQSGVSLALSKVQQNDVATAKQTLEDLRNSVAQQASEEQSFQAALLDAKGEPQKDEEENDIRDKFVPEVENWAWRRVELLINSELLGDQVGAAVSASAFAGEAKRGVIATSDGQGGYKLHLLEVDGSFTRVIDTTQVARPVESLAISPVGDEVVFSLESSEREQTVFRWKPSDEAPQPLKVRDSEFGLGMQDTVLTSNRLVMGANGGLWTWDRASLSSMPTQYANMGGNIMSMQMMNDSHVLVLTDGINGRHIYCMNLEEKWARGLVELKRTGGPLEREEPTCVAFSNNKILIGTDTGRLYVTAFDLAQKSIGPGFDEFSSQPHTSAIENIKVHSDGTLLTTARDAIAVVWKPAQDARRWLPEIKLNGAQATLQNVGFLDNSNKVFAVAKDGSPIVWDVKRQQQRNRLTRVDTNGESIRYDSPVIGFVSDADSSRVTAVHRDGSLDTFDSQTGVTLDYATAASTDAFSYSKSYYGHDPRAEFIDFAVDESANVMVTSVLLPRANSEPGATGEGVYEFCKWDLKTGEMIARWTRESVNRLEVSLLSDKYILYASDTETIIGDLDKNQAEDLFRSESEKGSYFGVVNPVKSSLVMLVKRSGAVSLFDTSKMSVLKSLEPRAEAGLLAANDPALLGRWSEDGERFFLLWSSGRLSEFEWQDGPNLGLVRDVKRNTKQLKVDWSAGKEGNLVARSKHELDFRVRSTNDANSLYVSFRVPGAAGETRFSQLDFPMGSGEVQATNRSIGLEKLPLLMRQTGDLNFASKDLAQLPVRWEQVVSTKNTGQHTYAALRNGTIWRTDGVDNVNVYGSTSGLLAASGNANGQRIVTLDEQGGLRRADFSDSWSWTTLPATVKGAREVFLSCDGSRLLVALAEKNELQLLDAESGTLLHSLPGYSACVWEQEQGKELEAYLVAKNGKVEKWNMVDMTNQPVGKVGEQEVPEIRGVQFFHEKWSNGKSDTRWLVIHARQPQNDEIHYVNISPQRTACPPLQLNGQIEKLASSPTDNVLAVADGSALRIFFANPTHKVGGKELFGLDGHDQTPLTALRFTNDGYALLSADEEKRLYGWLSVDAQRVEDRVAEAKEEQQLMVRTN